MAVVERPVREAADPLDLLEREALIEEARRRRRRRHRRNGWLVAAGIAAFAVVGAAFGRGGGTQSAPVPSRPPAPKPAVPRVVGPGVVRNGPITVIDTTMRNDGGIGGGLGIYTAEPNGVHRLVWSCHCSRISGFVWSPDGSQLAVAEWVDRLSLDGTVEWADDPSLHVVDVASGRDRTIGRGLSDVTWSRDGAWLAAIRLVPYGSGDPGDSTYGPGDPGFVSDGTIVLLRADGSRSVTLRPTAAGRDVSHPTWSADGSALAFSASPGIWTTRAEFSASPGIWTIRADGSGLRRIARLPDAKAAWSPSGDRIAVTFEDYDRRRCGVRLIAPTGTLLANFSPECHNVASAGMPLVWWTPVWSPDGREILLLDVSLRGHGIYALHADGTGFRRLTEDGANATVGIAAAWRPIVSTDTAPAAQG